MIQYEKKTNAKIVKSGAGSKNDMRNIGREIDKKDKLYEKVGEKETERDRESQTKQERQTEIDTDKVTIDRESEIDRERERVCVCERERDKVIQRQGK